MARIKTKECKECLEKKKVTDFYKYRRVCKECYQSNSKNSREEPLLLAKIIIGKMIEESEKLKEDNDKISQDIARAKRLNRFLKRIIISIGMITIILALTFYLTRNY